MNFDPEIIAKVGGPTLSAVVVGLIKHYAEARSRIISYIGHASSFVVQGDQQIVINTHAVVVQNAGRKAATNVRLSHAVLPVNITVFPPINYLIERNPEGSGEIVFPVLVPKEQVTVSYLYFPPLLWNQINVNAKSDEGFAKIIKVIPTPQPNRVVVFGLMSLAFIGTSFLFYWLVRMCITAI